LVKRIQKGYNYSNVKNNAVIIIFYKEQRNVVNVDKKIRVPMEEPGIQYII